MNMNCVTVFKKKLAIDGYGFAMSPLGFLLEWLFFDE